VKTRLTLKPGQHGTKSLMKKYGDSLVCVRFRYDAETGKRIKTVELVIEECDWTPPTPRFTSDTIVSLRIAASNLPIRTKAKASGAKWNPEKQLWFVNYGKTVGTELEKYIDIDGLDNKS